MIVTLYKDDYRDSGWFYILKDLDLMKNVKYDDIFDFHGELISEEFEELFRPSNTIEIEVNNFNLIK
jgi:hypothetical protein